MNISLQTLLGLRRAILALLSALDTALLEGYGWTPRRKKDIDADDILRNDSMVVG